MSLRKRYQKLSETDVGQRDTKIFVILRESYSRHHQAGFRSDPAGRKSQKGGVKICDIRVYKFMCSFEPAPGFGRVCRIRCGASTSDSLCFAWTPGWE